MPEETLVLSKIFNLLITVMAILILIGIIVGVANILTKKDPQQAETERFARYILEMKKYDKQVFLSTYRDKKYTFTIYPPDVENPCNTKTTCLCSNSHRDDKQTCIKIVEIKKCPNSIPCITTTQTYTPKKSQASMITKFFSEIGFIEYEQDTERAIRVCTTHEEGEITRCQ